MKGQEYPRCRRDEIVIQELDGEFLIYDLKMNKAYCLNETSALVYQLSDGSHSILEIKELVAGQLNSPVNEEVVWLALEQLKKENLIETEKDYLPFAGMNRREVIRKVGLTSMIALPVISSLVAPTAAQAQSGGCVNPGGRAPNTPVRIGNFAVCSADCSSFASQCCSNSVRTAIPCDVGRTSCVCN